MGISRTAASGGAGRAKLPARASQARCAVIAAAAQRGNRCDTNRNASTGPNATCTAATTESFTSSQPVFAPRVSQSGPISATPVQTGDPDNDDYFEIPGGREGTQIASGATRDR